MEVSADVVHRADRLANGLLTTVTERPIMNMFLYFIYIARISSFPFMCLYDDIMGIFQALVCIFFSFLLTYYIPHTEGFGAARYEALIW